MDDKDLEQRIKQRYFNEYYNKLRDADDSIPDKVEKFVARNETALWGLGGLGVIGAVAAFFFLPVAPAVAIASVVVAAVAGVPAFCVHAQEKSAFAARQQMQQDIDSGNLVGRYKEEMLKEDPHVVPKVERLQEKLVEQKAAADFAAAQQKEQAEAEAAAATAEDRQRKLKEKMPVKVKLK